MSEHDRIRRNTDLFDVIAANDRYLFFVFGIAPQLAVPCPSVCPGVPEAVARLRAQGFTVTLDRIYRIVWPKDGPFPPPPHPSPDERQGPQTDD